MNRMIQFGTTRCAGTFRTLSVALLTLVVAAPAPAAIALPAGTSIEAGFSPSGEALDVVLKTIGSAQREILVAAYSFTSRPIAQALVAAARRGIQVRVVADQGESTKGYSAVQFLANQRVPVRVNGRYNLLHDKYLLVDGRHLQTGSFNYTAAAAQSNAENALVIWNVPQLVARYQVDWQRLWNEGVDLKPRH